MSRRLGAVLAVVLLAQPACVGEIKERCPLVTEPQPAPALPHDFVRLDDLLRHRAFQMVQDVRQLHGSATTSFHIVFGSETLPLWCDWMVLARDLAMHGRLKEAGRKYQALLVLSQLMELAIALHATAEYADSVGELSLTISRTLETFGNQMEPLLTAALSEDPRQIERALQEHGGDLARWQELLLRWSAHVRADAERMKVAKAGWDITIGVIAAYETAGALAEVAAGGGPPIASLPALAGGGAAELSGAAYAELAEAIRRLIAPGALDAGVVAGLSAATRRQPAAAPSPGTGTAFHASGNEPEPGPASQGTTSSASGASRAERFGANWQRVSLRETVARIAGPDPVVTTTPSGKVIYANPTTGIRVVYDKAGNYFRVEDPTVNGSLRYLDQFGKPIPANSPVVGPNGTTLTGVPADVRNTLTHFMNAD